MDSAKRIREVLAKALADREWTQSELARKSGVSQGYISQILSGDFRRAGADILLRLQRGLGDPAVDLIGEPGSGGPTVEIDTFLASPWGSDVTPQEESWMRQARWVPSGKQATARDWFLFLQLVRGLQNKNSQP